MFSCHMTGKEYHYLVPVAGTTVTVAISQEGEGKEREEIRQFALQQLQALVQTIKSAEAQEQLLGKNVQIAFVRHPDHPAALIAFQTKDGLKYVTAGGEVTSDHREAAELLSWDAHLEQLAKKGVKAVITACERQWSPRVQVQAAIVFLRDVYPDDEGKLAAWAELLHRLKEEDPNRFQDTIGKLAQIKQRMGAVFGQTDKEQELRLVLRGQVTELFNHLTRAR